MPTGPITIKLVPEPWLIPYIQLCTFFMKRGWELDEEAFKVKALTGIKVV